MSKFNYKQAIIFRDDITMSKGKIAAQAGHAAVSSAEEAKKKRLEWWNAWIEEGQCKIVLKVNSRQELLTLEKEAKTLKLPFKLISDRGLTEIPPGTISCLGIGPAPSNLLNKITGDLPLL